MFGHLKSLNYSSYPLRAKRGTQLSTVNYQLSTVNSYVPHSHLVLVPQLVDGAFSA